MTIETTLQTASALLAPWTAETQNPYPNRVDVTLPPGDLISGVRALVDAQWGYLSAVTALDLGVEAGIIEVLYHFCSEAAILTLRVRTPRSEACVPSVCAYLPYASLYERELIEMFGIRVEGTPDTSRLFLPDDWLDGVYPARKDFIPGSTPCVNPEAVSTGIEDGVPQASTGGKFVVPIGPQHPALKEPGHFELTVDGEIVTAASVRLGYVHRGIEKACEDRTWIQNLYLLERVCGICSHIHAYAYCLGVEQLAGVEVPFRAQAIRELVAGLERIHSHLLWLGVAAHEAGFDTLVMYSWRDREIVMDMLEKLSGNRVNYSINVLGGVKFDVDKDQAGSIRSGLDILEKRTQHYLEVVTTDAAFLQRTRGIGITTAEQAAQLGIVGPTARASGVLRDIRVEAPYGAYTHFPVSVGGETAGDLEAKFIVRLKELFVSINTIRAILDNLREGDLSIRMPRKIPAGEAISRVEAPRGELFYFIKSNGSEKPERVKARTPSMCNFASVISLVVGHQLADVPMIIAGIDPCFSCNDRSVTIYTKPGMSESWTWEKLRRYGIEYYRR